MALWWIPLPPSQRAACVQKEWENKKSVQQKQFQLGAMNGASCKTPVHVSDEICVRDTPKLFSNPRNGAIFLRSPGSLSTRSHLLQSENWKSTMFVWEPHVVVACFAVAVCSEILVTASVAAASHTCDRRITILQWWIEQNTKSHKCS